jgi:hypothetical protein
MKTILIIITRKGEWLLFNYAISTNQQSTIRNFLPLGHIIYPDS